MLDELDKKIIAAMQEDFPLVAQPYREIADSLGISEDELLGRLNKYNQSGKIRKMGAVLRHREVGYNANALCAWIVPDERIQEVGRLFAKAAVVTHCYARIVQPGWPYNFYTMLHANTREQCKMIAQELADQAGLEEYIMLFSTKEWKKNSMKYFK
ncbi:MAG: Lrp/AsnC family transcriptional regulator [Sporomusaceae bacterium]|nr:Lrp/AsnC family transcriptional regulator [Sporomusaceae bacterium]